MKRFLFILFCLYMAGGTAYAQLFLPVKVNNSWGLIDTAGRMVIEPQYEFIEDLKSSPLLKVARKNGKAVLLRVNDKELFSPWFDEIYPFGDTVVLTLLNGRQGLMDHGGNIILPNSFSAISMNRRRYLASEDDENTRLYDGQGKDLLGKAYDSICVFSSFVLGLSGNSCDIYNSSYRLIRSGTDLPSKISFPFMSLVPHNRHEFIIIDSSGKQVTNDHFSSWESAGSDFLIAKGKQDHILFRKTGRSIPVPSSGKFTELGSDSVKFLELEMFGENRVYSSYGNTFRLPDSTHLYRISGENFLVTLRNYLSGLIDVNGRVILDAKFGQVEVLENNIIRVSSDRKSGLYTQQGKLVLPIDYDRIECAGNAVRAYRDRTQTLIILDQAANIVERQDLNDVTPLYVSASAVPYNESYTGGRSGEKANRSSLGSWRFDDLKKLWGFTRNDTFLIKPAFRNIRRLMTHGVTEVSNTSNKIGLVDDSTGRILHLCGYDILYTGDLDSTAGTLLRGMNKKGMYLLKTNGTAHRRRFAYIDNFHNGMARYNSGGFFTARNTAELGPEYRVDPNGIPMHSYDFSDRTAGSVSPRFTTITGGKWGFIDTKGRVTADNQYDWVTSFKGNVSFVKNAGKWGMVTLDNKSISPRYDGIDFLDSNDRHKLITNNYASRYCFIDRQGNVVSGPLYHEAWPFKCGMARVLRDGKFYFINYRGEEVNKASYSQARDFHNGFAAVKTRKSWGVIDTSGSLVLDTVYKKIGGISEGWVEVFNGMWGYVSLSGENSIPFNYQRVMPFSGERAWVRIKGRWGMIDSKGEYRVRPAYTEVKYSAQKGIFFVRKRNSWRIVDAEGKKMFGKNFRKFRDFTEGVAALSKGNRHYLLDLSTLKHIKVKASSVGPFSEGLAIIGRNHRYGAIDKNGEVVIPVKYPRLDAFSEGKAACLPYLKKDKKGNRLAYMDTKGNLITKASYKMAGPFVNGWARVLADSFFQYISLDGLKIKEKRYTALKDFNDSIGVVSVKNRVALVNSRGIYITPFNFSEIKAISEGKALLKINKLYGLADTDGKIYFEPEFERIFKISGKLYRAERGNEVGYFHLDKGWIWELRN
jgi:hypothetical protein